MDKSPSIFIPNIYKKLSLKETTDNVSLNEPEQQTLQKNIVSYIDSCISRLVKPNFETFEDEDIKPDIFTLIHELQVNVDNCLKKTGGTMSGTLNILKLPQAKFDAVNKEYVDWLFLTLKERLESMAPKQYVDDKVESNIQPLHHIFSKGQILTTSIKKTFFFNPGFICPQRIHIISVGFSTSPYKYKIGESIKMGEINPTKLYFMINNEIKSEYSIEKDVQLGHILKEFDNPITFEKGDNLMMVVESMIEDASVNVTFY